MPVKLPRAVFAESAVDRFLSAHLTNRQYNKVVWSLYPALWRLGEVAGVRRRSVPADRALVGDEWGTPREVAEIIAEFIEPFVTSQTVAGEIGVGGARIAARVAPVAQEFYCFDVSSGMLRKAQRALGHLDRVHYVKLRGLDCPAELKERLDFVYAFDVLVHLDLHELWRAITMMSDLLRPGGRALVHVANLNAPLGWDKFSRQKGFSVGGLYFVSPEIVSTLADHAGFSKVKESRPDSRNEYLARDYLVVLEKAGNTPAPAPGNAAQAD